jgi:hypothetical protein
MWKPSRSNVSYILSLLTTLNFMQDFSQSNNFTNVNLEIKILICKWKCTSSYSLILTHSHQDMLKTSRILWTNTKIATVIIHYGTFSVLNNFTNVNLEIKILICRWKCTSSYSLILTHSHQDMFKTSLILWTNTKIATVCKWTLNTLHHKMHVHFFKHFKLNLFLRYFILVSLI